MIPLGMIVTFVGYGVGSWGYILVRGYNITLRQWFSPLNPYTGPLSAAGMVPPGSVFPTSGKGSKGTTSAPPSKPVPQSQVRGFGGRAPGIGTKTVP